MGNQKHKWAAYEEEALLAGINKHGAGKWKNILNDPEFAPFLTFRSNIDLKDKWRNLSVNNGEKPKNPKIKTTEPPTPAPAGTQNALVVPPLRACATSDAAADDSSHNSQDVKQTPQYNSMIFEALSMISDDNGPDLNAIVSFIEKRHKVPQNFRKAVGARLRKLVDQGKLEKVQNCYRVKRATPLETKQPAPKRIDSRPYQSLASGFTASHGTVRDAVEISTCRVAEAEDKSHLAAEAVKEAEKLSKLAEDADAMLQLTEEIYEQCSRGEIIILA